MSLSYDPLREPVIQANRRGLVSELAARYLGHIKASNIDQSHYTHCRIFLSDFLLPLCADFPADEFSPKCLKFVRGNMVHSKRLCRNLINDYVRRIIAMFSFGVEEEICLLKPLPPCVKSNRYERERTVLSILYPGKPFPMRLSDEPSHS